MQNLEKRLDDLQKMLQANVDATSKNKDRENKANKDAAVLRVQLERPLREHLPAAEAPAAASSDAAQILREAGITKLSLKCEKTKDLARRTTEDTWIQLMLLGCTPKARDFINQQRWEDCEEIVESATTRYLPHREEAHHIFAKACPGAEMGTRHFSCLVLLYKLAKLKANDGVLPQEPPEAPHMQQQMPQNVQFSPGASTALGNLTKVRGDGHEVEEQITMDPDHKDILLIKAIYETERLNSLRAMAGIVKDHHLPSKRLWGRFEKMKRDVGYFEVLEWGKMESKTRGKAAIKKQREGLQMNANGGWNLPDLDLGLPRKMDYLWDTITVIRNTLWLSQISLDWSILKKFHDHFEQNMKNSLRETRHTRPHDVSEVYTTYEYAMRIWEDETKKIYMKIQSPDGPQSFDQVLSCCTEEEDYTMGGFFLRMTPRVASAASTRERSWSWDTTPTRRVRSRGRGRGRGGGRGEKGKGKGRGKSRSTSRPQYNIWQGAASTATQWHEPAWTPRQDKGSGKGKANAKGKKGKGKPKGAGKEQGKGPCYFWQESGTCPRSNCAFSHSH